MLKEAFPRVGEIPFDSGRKMMTTVHQTADGFVQYTKGAPDVIVDRCTHYLLDGKAVPMTDEYRAQILAANKAMADKALRVLACSQKILTEIPETLDTDSAEKELCFVGLCGMIDPVRPEVKDAIARCREAGIRPIMITGDHIDTAVAIAKELGIMDDGIRAISGAELNQMTDEEFEQHLEYLAFREKESNPDKIVLCPRCGKELRYREAGKSYEIKCSTDGCIKMTCRGI